MLNLDTHVLVAILNDGLTPREVELVLKSELAISGVVLWELAKLIQLGRLDLNLDSAQFRQCLRQVCTVPITLEIARASTRLDFTSDPADEIIAATSIVERIPLLTRDRRILKSRLVPLAK
ncbi:MAG: type II toxin-antitoxin system VapC family toxin [Terriglobia bacterium]|jgi:PIN domain nuclease of toxin-antitoxin system